MNIPIGVIILALLVVAFIYLFVYSLCSVAGSCSRAEEMREYIRKMEEKHDEG